MNTTLSLILTGVGATLLMDAWGVVMGAGVAASRTPKPNSARLQSLITHTVFGLGLWVRYLVTTEFP
jgi:hypothetical protein